VPVGGVQGGPRSESGRPIGFVEAAESLGVAVPDALGYPLAKGDTSVGAVRCHGGGEGEAVLAVL